MKALITGATGFVGGYLAHALEQKGYEAIGTYLSKTDFAHPFEHLETPLFECDVTRADAVRALVKKIKPHFIFHLAAVAHVPDSFADPVKTHRVNTLGTAHVLEAFKTLRGDPRFIYISTAQVYGSLDKERVAENDPCRPDNPYAVSKLNAELMIHQYALHFKIDTVILRAFNHIGIGQSERVSVASFAKQIARIEKRLDPPTLHTGSLSPVRDFTDVRDVVQAYLLAAEKGASGTTYNVGSGQGRAIKEIVDILRSFSSKKIDLTLDKTRIRPTDPKRFVADSSALRQATGWGPKHDLKKTLREIYEWWLKRVKA